MHKVFILLGPTASGKSLIAYMLIRHYLNVIDNNILIIDVFGILKHLYKYSKIAYVGGGFGKGVHNTFEPLVYNNTVCYGPNIDLLNEAKEMKESNLSLIHI